MSELGAKTAALVDFLELFFWSDDESKDVSPAPTVYLFKKEPFYLDYCDNAFL